MVNQDILTSLRNSIERGESLEKAKSILISSGYNPKEIEDASKFVSSGVISFHQSMPDENLIMPNKKSILEGFSKEQIPNLNPSTKLLEKQPTENEIKEIKKEFSRPVIETYSVSSMDGQKSNKNFASELKDIAPRKSYTKEIILLVILLLLIGILVGTILYKEQIINFLSNIT